MSDLNERMQDLKNFLTALELNPKDAPRLVSTLVNEVHDLKNENKRLREALKGEEDES